MIRLNIIENDKKRFFETDKKEISLGRSINNDIMLRNSLSSRNHCIIEEQDKNFFIRDLQSRNGIRVNGKWIEQTPLYIGDLIQIGKVTSITVLAEKPSLEETDLLLQPEEPQIIPILQEVPTREELKKVPKEDTLTSKFSLVLNEREKLVRLYEITKAINSELHKEKLLEMIMDAAIELTKAERGCIFIIEENKPNKLEIARNLDRSDIKAEDFKLSQSVIQTVLTKGKAVITTNAQEDKRFAGSISVRDQQLRSVLCIPFLVKSKVLGVVYLDHRFVEVQFSQPDVHLLEVFAEQAAIAIENARLYEELQQKERISFEIETAALIQQQLLPTQAPEIKGLKIAGNTIPAHKVGGDYYDFIPLETDPNFLYICIGDVSGHGIAAGLIMVMIRSIFHALIPHKLSTKEILVEANKILFTSIPKNMFLSLNLLRWNAFAQKLTYTSAGHEFLIHYQAKTQKSYTIMAGGVVLGPKKEIATHVQEKELQMSPGDMLLLYTDGVTEALSEDGKLFTLKRLQSLVEKYGDLDPQELIDKILARLRKYLGTQDQEDDITLVALKRVEN